MSIVHLTKFKYFALVATLGRSANTQLTRIANHDAAAAVLPHHTQL